MRSLSAVLLTVPLVVISQAAIEGAESLEQSLQRKMSLTIERDSLENVLVALAAKVRKAQPEFAIRILGNDLQFEGITRNQNLRDFREDDKPVAEILTAIVMRANPNTSVKVTSDANQKLIWILVPIPRIASGKSSSSRPDTLQRNAGTNCPPCFRPSSAARFRAFFARIQAATSTKLDRSRLMGCPVVCLWQGTGNVWETNV